MEIQPIKQFTKEGFKYATWLQVRGIGDNYKDRCENIYELCEVVTETITEGIGENETTTETIKYVPLLSDSCVIDGEDYINWDNSNEQIVEIVAGKIGVETI